MLVIVFKDVAQRVLQTLTTVAPDLGQEVIALRQAERGRRHRAGGLNRLHLEGTHALVDAVFVHSRAAKQIAEEFALHHAGKVVHLLHLAGGIPGGQCAPGAADLAAKPRLITRGFHAQHLRPAGKIREELLALADREQRGYRVKPAVAQQVNAFLRAGRHSGPLKPQIFPLGEVLVKRTDLLLVGNQKQSIHGSSCAETAHPRMFFYPTKV